MPTKALQGTSCLAVPAFLWELAGSHVLQGCACLLVPLTCPLCRYYGYADCGALGERAPGPPNIPPPFSLPPSIKHFVQSSEHLTLEPI